MLKRFFSTVKARLQLQPSPPLYTGMMDCVTKTVRTEGWRGLYKGMGSPLLGVDWVL